MDKVTANMGGVRPLRKAYRDMTLEELVEDVEGQSHTCGCRRCAAFAERARAVLDVAKELHDVPSILRPQA